MLKSVNKIVGNNMKSISKDFTLNLFASIISTGTIQLVLYPVIAAHISAASYGILLTLMGLANTVAAAVGGSLNNTRLLLNCEYEKKKLCGDFNLILFIAIIIVTIACPFFVVNFDEANIILIFLLIAFTDLSIIRSYISVAYRIKLNFKRILCSNIIVAIGSLIGLVIFLISKQSALWVFPFLLGELCGDIYIGLTTDILREDYRATKMFAKTINKEFILLITTLSANLLTYLDRLLLLPLLGGEAVTTYTVASVFGKSLGIVMTPLAGVLLSYYAQKNYVMNRRKFWKQNITVLVLALGMVVISAVLAGPLTGVLYPSAIEAAMPYLLIANITAIINVIGNMTQPVVLKYAPTIWQLVIQCIYCCEYLILGILFTNANGLLGFAIAALIAAASKTILLYFIGHIYLRGK